MDLGEDSQDIYKSVRHNKPSAFEVFSQAVKDRLDGIKQVMNPHRKAVMAGYTLAGLSGATLLLGAWDIDWAQFDVVDLPVFGWGHVKVSDKTWLAKGIGCGILAQYLAFKSGKILGEADGYKEAQADIDPKSYVHDHKAELGRKTIGYLQPLGFGLSALGIASTATTFVLDQFAGVNDFAGQSHGQLWNFSWLALAGTGTILGGVGSYMKGVGDGLYNYLGESGIVRKGAKTYLPAEELTQFYLHDSKSLYEESSSSKYGAAATRNEDVVFHEIVEEENDILPVNYLPSEEVSKVARA